MYSRFKTLIGKLYAIVLIIFAVWYGNFIYPIIFSHADHHEEPPVEQQVFGTTVKAPEAASFEEEALQKVMKEQKATATTDLGYTVVKEQYVKGHFHHIGMMVEPDETNVCTRCHGAVPHDKSKPIRAFLNMHAFFVACETCHIKQKPDQGPWAFRWYDKANGQVVANPPGLVATEKEKYGNYGTKIAPGTLAADGNFRFLNGDRERAFVTDYLKNKDGLSTTEQSKMKKVIHRMVDEKPLLCDSCHTSTQTPYVPFAELGYPPRRIQQLTNTEVVGMLHKYSDFHIPKFLLPGTGAAWTEGEKSKPGQSPDPKVEWAETSKAK
ncbi:MAG: hypothetical protein WC392_02410 [Sulfuricella sp.]|jgi:hypothetical protein